MISLFLYTLSPPPHLSMLPSGTLSFSPRKRVSQHELPKTTKEKQTDGCLAFQPNGPSRPLDPIKPTIAQRTLKLTRTVDKKSVSKAIKKTRAVQKRKGSVPVNSIKQYLTSSVTTSSSPLANELKLDTAPIDSTDNEDRIPCVVRHSTSILSLLPTFLEEFNPTIEFHNDEYAALLEADKLLNVVQVEAAPLAVRKTVPGTAFWDEMMGCLDNESVGMTNEYLALLEQDKEQSKTKTNTNTPEAEAEIETKSEGAVPQMTLGETKEKGCKVRHTTPIMSLWPIFEDTFEVRPLPPASATTMQNLVWKPRNTTSLTALWSIIEGDLQSNEKESKESKEDIRPYNIDGRKRKRMSDRQDRVGQKMRYWPPRLVDKGFQA
ncbi:hypothetical protein CLU79DRAFT_582651 [Phycomyces nitens]|nr:hypothetical protein CLU79DRAFT_582651 [Phycomyces nitens]